ncbi:MAG TPA: hypothetical protein VG758_01265 [Hyphomicrobiaceae bacterium]|jgi:hypothetical protein|nr:hypothetical protein [Hyphomicrobiaceae bacterium]
MIGIVRRLSRIEAAVGSAERDARRLRVLNLMCWIGCAFATGWGMTQLLDSTPGMWKGAAVNAAAALVYALIPQLARVAPLTALVTSSIFTNAYLFTILYLFGTRSRRPPRPSAP